MKTLQWQVSIALIALAWSCFAQDRPPSDISRSAVTILLKTEQQQFTLGQPIHVTVVMSNVSGSDIEWNEGWVYTCEPTERGGQRCVPTTHNRFRFTVRDSKGVELPKTDFHKDLFGERGHGGAVAMSNFGEDKLRTSRPRQYRADLHELFEFSQPGEYTVEVSRRELDERERPLLKSNTITIRIVQ